MYEVCYSIWYFFQFFWFEDYILAQKNRDLSAPINLAHVVILFQKLFHPIPCSFIFQFALEENQRYKESHVILEKALIREKDGFLEDVFAA